MSRRKVIVGCGCLALVGVLCCIFPPFRVRPLDESADARPSRANAADPVNVYDYAGAFWSDRLPKAFGDAVEIGELLETAERDAEQAQSQFGRQVGLGGACHFFLRGSATVTEINRNDCTLKIGDGPRRARIRTGVIIGNTVRDGTGLIDVNQFASSQDFNNLSAELNKRVETDVIASFRDEVCVGDRVRFIGCAQVRNDSDFDEILIVPMRLDIDDLGVQP